MMNKNKSIKNILIIVFLVFLVMAIIGFTLAILFASDKRDSLVSDETITNEVSECITKTKEKIVKGSSLYPLIKDGQIIKAFFGYYDCNQIQRDDVVLYSWAGNEVPLIKIIRGVPGDSFKLEKIEQEDFWHISINGEILKNSVGDPYLISGQRYQMLSLYEGEIFEGTYLLLGNMVFGGTDSTQFGLIHKNDILAKVLWE